LSLSVASPTSATSSEGNSLSPYTRVKFAMQ
jgi:hypothetical protein